MTEAHPVSRGRSHFCQFKLNPQEFKFFQCGFEFISAFAMNFDVFTCFYSYCCSNLKVEEV